MENATQTRAFKPQNQQSLEPKIMAALIPTGERYRTAITPEDLRSRTQNRVSFFLPNKDGELINIDAPSAKNNSFNANYEINWGYASTHSPEVRAKMLYDAIFNKELDYIDISGSRGNEYTIMEFEKLIRNEDLPKLDKMPIVCGSSDATNLLVYLGQKGIAKPYIASIFDFFPPKNERKPAPLKKDDLKQKIARTDDKCEILEGVLIPEYLLRSYGTLQEMKLIKGGINFLATEIHFPGEAELMIEAYKNIKPEDRRNIVFCLSAVGCSNEKEVDEYIKKQPNNDEERLEKLRNNLMNDAKPNDIKRRGQERFKNWCIENGFTVIEGLKFGHHNNPDQHSPVPCYCKCTLNGDILEYDTDKMIKPLPTDFARVEIPQQGEQQFDTIEFGKNYEGGGGSEVSTYVMGRNKNGRPLKYATIFSQIGNLQPKNNEIDIKFISFKEFGNHPYPSYVYIQDLERVLKDIDKLLPNSPKTIKISGFDLPLEAKADSGYRWNKERTEIIFDSGKERKTIKEAIIETVTYISKNYPKLRDVKIDLGNGLEFKNNICIERQNAQSCLYLG